MPLINPSLFDERLRSEVEKVWPISCKQVFEMDDIELRKHGNFTVHDIRKLRDAAASIMLPNPFRTAKEIEVSCKERWRRISLGCKGMDSILGGGIPVRGITELSGESGVGKTQVCLQLAISAQYPLEAGGLDAGTVYICTEDRFPSKRLHQMLQDLPSRTQFGKPVASSNFANRIYVDHVADVESLKECISLRLPRLLSNLKIGVVILDSIAAVFRSEYEGLAQSNHRAHQIRTIAMRLHAVARTHNLAVVVVNQVTESIDEGKSVPALGLVWANMVTTKLEVAWHTRPCLGRESIHSSNRKLNVISAPHLPPASTLFCISSTGILDVPEEQVPV